MFVSRCRIEKHAEVMRVCEVDASSIASTINLREMSAQKVRDDNV